MSSEASTIRVESWSELQNALFADSWNPKIGRYRSHHAFRGLSDAAYPLATTLMRLGGPYVELERHLVRNFRKYARGSVVEQDSLWHWVSVAQHYGLPTRLLDWSNSPYVALHFATANLEKYDVDGAIWVVDYTRVHQLIPAALRRPLEAEGAGLFTVEMLSQTVASFADLGAMAVEPFAFFLEPPSIDPRIFHQYALFSVASAADLSFDDWLAKHASLFKKIIIPAELKWEVRDKVDLANINERTLFPGLTGLCHWLHRYYSPKERGSAHGMPINPLPGPPPMPGD